MGSDPGPRSVTGAGTLAGVIGAALALTGLLVAPAVAATDAPAATSATTSATTSGTTTGPTTAPALAPARVGGLTPTACPSPPTPPPPGTVVSSSTFEDGTTGGWTGSAGVTVDTSDTVAATGTHSLRLAGLTAGSTATVRLDSPPVRAWYQVTARIKVASPQAPAPSLTLRPVVESPIVISPGNVIVGSVPAGSGGWVTVHAYFQADQMYPDPDVCNETWVSPRTMAHVLLQLVVARPCGQVAEPATVYLDDVTVTYSGDARPTPTPVPGSPAPLCGTTSPPVTPPCEAAYLVRQAWAGGYLADVVIRSRSGVTAPNWKVTWQFPDDQRITTMWQASYLQDGRAVTVTPPSWASSEGGGTVGFGFLGTSTGNPGTPPAIALDGQACDRVPA